MTCNATITYMQTILKLIDKFVPKNYKLSINIYREERIIKGLVSINGNVCNNTNSVEFHCKDLNIKSVNFDGKSAHFSINDDILSVSHNDINSGEHIFDIVFEGDISDSMHGIYPCYYDHNGIKKELIATQFESHHAREVFPCIDEPAAKATFEVTLTTETNVTVLGNMPIKNQKIEDEKLVTSFKKTPKMSSYLLAWVIGELQNISGKTKGGIDVSVWSTPAQPINSLDFALDIAIRSIDFYNEYFGVPYPLKKCDHVALPDFSSGAMENWGLITYREIALLADPKLTGISTKRYIATVIAHELSHQWFGNLVTMEWWDDLWLNESFASLVEYMAVDALQPDWNIWLDFASYDAVIALKRDSLDGVQPVKTGVSHPNEISTLFDGAIVYAKGARLLQMLKHYIGEAAFKEGLKQYFKKFAYKNTKGDDLWETFSKTSRIDVKRYMDTWLTEPGYPVISVSKKNSEITIIQERLRSKASPKSHTIWPITLNSSCADVPKLLTKKSDSFSTNSSELIRYNVGNFAHYITNYDYESKKLIFEKIKNNELSTIDKIQFINEQTILCSMGKISNADLIPLVQTFSEETEETVWDMISVIIGELKKFVSDNELAESKLKHLVKKLANRQFERLGWEKIPNESEFDTKLRSTILGLMIYSENQIVIDEANRRFNQLSIDKLDPELRSLIICAVIKNTNDTSVIESLIKIYKTTSSPEIKQDINIGLTATKNKMIIDNLLNLILDTATIRTQDTARWIAYLLRNKYAREQTWQFIMNNWDWIDKNFSGDKSYDDYPRYAANALSNPEQLKQYVDFFTPLKSDKSLTRVINIGINEITNRVELVQQDADLVCKKLLDL